MTLALKRPRTGKGRIIVPLDLAQEEKLQALIEQLDGRVGLAKVGKELFTALGPRAVAAVRESGLEVFLDLKYHDIPNTVAGAVRAAAKLGVSMLTVHAQGGRAMLAAAVAAARQSDPSPAVIAVTVLTSLSGPDLTELGLTDDPAQQVERLAALALDAGVDGLVCSPLEVGKLRQRFGSEPFLVTPGIRPVGAESHDQARVATPAKALAAGADFLVIGRPITGAADPAAAATAIAQELDGN